MDLNYQFFFKGIVLFTIAQRVYELFLSKKNEKIIFEKGGHLVKENNYLFMVILHSSWLAVLLYFSMYINLTISKNIFHTFFICFVIGQCLRVVAIKTLGERWSTRIVVLPGVSVVKIGIFKYFRHPNYLGVIIELASLPLMVSLYKVSAVFSLLNLVILFFRIRLEESSLNKFNDYNRVFSLTDKNENI